ncbi:pyridoxamine kinase [uncultured Acetobacteroides sp.]|uniref:pyridoxamine kinase n=1 Tax=uncultured Acetobacteroides sp. TaxID=1760811 RepID=UPI0029F5BB45|nr:pyridoxamine kinase [uncultured Acetobacteroides sp.]
MFSNPVKRVAAIHDMSGFGRVSLTVIIPILSSMGIQVCPLPTAILSTHSQYEGFEFVDLTPNMQPIIDHWKRLKLHFDAIYSGFLGSAAQIDIVAKFIDDFRDEKVMVVVDPVLGDNGKRYTPISEDMVTEMQMLVKKADIITPNLTEVFLLLNEPYTPKVNHEQIRSYLLRLAEMGPKIVMITSIPATDDQHTSVIAYNREDGRFWKVSCSYLPAAFPGTGDTFASVIVGSILQGDSLPIALDRAVNFASLGVRATFGYPGKPLEGILLERILPSLSQAVQPTSYQLLNWSSN